jgi:IclR family acetate operon transcriptional repressor
MATTTGVRTQLQRLDTKVIHSLDKGLQVLELVASSDGHATLAGMTEKLRWDKSTVFRLLTTLTRRGYVEQDAISKRYRLGYRLLGIQQTILQSLDYVTLTRDVLSQLAESTREASHFAILQNDHGVVISQKNSPEKIGVWAQPGEIEPLHCTAVGKALLIQMQEVALHDVVSKLDMKAYTPNTITSRQELLEAIRKMRAAGYAIDKEEYVTGARCIAAPVKIPGSHQLFAIGISGPASRVVTGRIPGLVASVLKAAAELNVRFTGELPRRS